MPDPVRRQLSLGHLMGAGLIDSTGLAFGWTVLLLVVSRQRGLGEAAILTSSCLAGMALAAPFSAWVSPRMSPRHLLQRLAVGEALFRATLFVLLALGVGAWGMAPFAVVTNMVAWTAYAAMRAQVSKAGDEHPGKGLTWYAVSILGAEALAAGGASLLIVHPAPVVLVLVGLAYTVSLAPQWWVGAHAGPASTAPHRTAFDVRRVVVPSVVGALVFLIAAGPALLASVLAFERYGARGVIVAALAFTVGSLGSARLETWVRRMPSHGVASCLLGAAMVGSWAAWSLGLAALAVAQLCVGLTQCCLEGDLDARTLAGMGSEESAAVTGLAIASSSRALGGAVAVALLPAVAGAVTLPVAAAAASGVLLAAAAVILLVGRLVGRAEPTVSAGRRVPGPRSEARTPSWRP